VTLRISSRLYSEGGVRAAMEHFSGCARFRLRRSPGAFRIDIAGVSGGQRRSLPGEFLNLALLAGRK